MSSWERLEKEKKERLMVFQIFNRKDYFDSTKLKIEIEKVGVNHVTVSFQIDLPDSIKFPRVKFQNSRAKANISRIAINAKMGEGNRQNIGETESDGHFWLHENKGKVSLDLTPESFKNFKVGKHKILLDIRADLQSLGGDKSQIHPFTMNIQFEMDVEPIYVSTLYFQELVLNEKEADRILGPGNDHSNSTPEACIKIQYQGKTIMYDYSRNSYRLRGNMNKIFYHNGPGDKLHVSVMDADYFINSNDLISDTLILIDSLIGNSYKNILMQATDKCSLYCTSRGQIN